MIVPKLRHIFQGASIWMLPVSPPIKSLRCSVTRRLLHLCRPSQHACVSPEGSAGPPWRVLFLGTDDFALHHLQALNDNRQLPEGSAVKSLDVVVSSKKCVVYKYATRENLTVHRWPLPDLQGHYDMGVIVSFGHLIPDSVISMFPRGMLNVHPSLLPRWRGAAPIPHAVLSGDKSTGISIIKIRPNKFDVGPIMATRTVDIPDRSTATQLQNILAQHGVQMDCIHNISTIAPQEQDTSKDKATYACKFQLKHTYVNWSCSVDEIDRHFRALGDLLNIRSVWRDQHVRLRDMVPPAEMTESVVSPYLAKFDASTTPLGFTHYIKQLGLLAIKCQDGWVGFRHIMIRKAMTAKEFHNGYLSKPENRDVLFISQDNGLDKYFRVMAY